MSSRRKLETNKDVEVDDLLAQIEQLRIENEELKKQINVMQQEPNKKALATPRRQTRSVTVTPTVGKGCSCKGNCSTRICGCMKKNMACIELCRCNTEKCCNKEIDQENMGNTNQQSPRRHPALESDSKTDGEVMKARSLFSPEDNVKKQSVSTKTKEKKEKAGRSRRELLTVPEKEKKLRSLSNDEVKSKIALGDDNSKHKRSVSMGNRNADKKSSKTKPASSLKEMPGKSKAVGKRDRKGRKAERSDNSDAEDEEVEDKKPVEIRQKPKLQKTRAIGKKSKHVDSMKSNDSSEDTNDEVDNIESLDSNANDTEDENMSISSPEIQDKKTKTKAQTIERYSSEDESDNNHNHSESSASPKSSNESVEPPENLTKVEQQDDVFDPMKPRRQLPRSPLVRQQENAAALTAHASRQFPDRNETLLPIPPPEETSDTEEQPPEDITKPVVDWDQHKAELVKCKKCGRTFYPYRLKKHEAHCLEKSGGKKST